MKLTPLLFSALLLSGSALTLTNTKALARGVTHTAGAASDAYDTLNEEFEASVEKWKADQIDASEEDLRELRNSKPAAAYWERFGTLAANGDGQAMFWRIAHIRAASIKSHERAGILEPLYRTLVMSHTANEWFPGVLAQLMRDRRTIGEETTLELYEIVISGSKSDESRAGALYQAGLLLKKSDDAKQRERGEAYHARVEAEFGETSSAAMLREVRAKESVQVGKMAPDFKASTIDDFEFNLADYRGKVVMLDFYGFW